MALKITDTIRGPARGTADEALSHIDRPDENDGIFTRTIYANAPKVALDPAIVMAQVHLESAGLTSPRYRNDKNPSGLGIPADDTPQPFVIPNYEVAALMHLSALNRLVDGTKPEPWTLPANVEAWLSTVWKRHCNQAPPVRTIDDLNIRYQADGDSNATWAWDESYQDGILERARHLYPNLPNQGATQPSPGETPVPDIVTFGLVARPAIADMICAKPFEGAGFTRVSPRQIVGACDHITDGNGTLQFYHDFFSTGGERARDALVDFAIDKQGKIAMLNDPFGTRMPWANGGSDGLEGDGPLFVRTLGVGAINGRLASIEHVGVSPAKMTDAQMQASAALKAWLFDRAHVPWDRFPFNPNVNCVTHLQHFEFATKPCPGSGIRAQTDDLQNRIRAIMKAAQTSTTQPTPVPPPTPVETDKEWFGRYRESELKARFSDLVRHNVDGSTTTFFFARTGLITNAWIARAASENMDVSEIPTPDDWFVNSSTFTPQIDVVSFGSGAWILERHSDRDGFVWLK